MMVLCVGLCVCDVIASGVSRDVFERDTCMLSDLRVMTGGDAYNVATALARLGTPTTLVGRVGKDPNGDFLRAQLAKAGVRAALSTDVQHATATSIVLVEKSGERHFLYLAGANDTLCAQDIPEAAWGEAIHLHVSGALLLRGLDGSLAQVFEMARAHHLTTSLDVAHDPSGEWMNKLRSALPFVDVFMPSEEEARMLTGQGTPERMAEALLKAGVKAVALKLGARGCYVTDGQIHVWQPALDCVNIVDTNGCGDAFCAGFLHHWLSAKDLRGAALFASATAAHCAGHTGAGVHCGVEEIYGILKRQQAMPCACQT